MEQSTSQVTSKTEAWFDNLVATLRSHEVQLETGVATNETKKFYETVFGGNADEIVHLGKSLAQKHFVARIIVDFLGMIKNLSALKMAFDFNDSEVLVWAEIKENDEVTERALLVAQAHINAKYHPFGFDMETTIVEEEDALTIPNHYKIYKA
jgi:hypothetical protein